MYAMLPNKAHFSVTCVLSELHHGLHSLWVSQSHEPEQLGPPTAFMKIHLYGLLFLFKHLKHIKNDWSYTARKIMSSASTACEILSNKLYLIITLKAPHLSGYLISFNLFLFVSSNKLNLTCLWWERVRLCRWRKRSQSVQRFPHMLHRMMAAVSPSSWLSHMGCRHKTSKWIITLLMICL